MRLSAIIPATDAPPTLARCLDAISRAADGPDELHVVTECDLPGPAAARNAGVAATDGELVLFVDADVLVHADAFSRLRHIFAEQPDVVAVFGSYDDRVATQGVVAAYRNLLHHIIHHRHPGPARTFWAGLGAVRRTAFEAAGGFDADRYQRASIEDIELGTRLSDEGVVLLDPRIQGTHLKQWSLRSMVDTDIRRRGIPWVELLLERRDVPRALNLGARERASAVVAVATLAAATTRRPTLATAGLAAQAPLNADLVRLVRLRVGSAAAVLALGLHTLHQLTAAASIPAGLVAHSIRRRGRFD